MKRNPIIILCFMLCCLVLPAFAFAQADTAKIDIPMKNGKVNYESTSKNIAGKAELLKRASKWFNTVFPDQSESKAVIDQQAGTINGFGLFKVVTSDSGNYYWLKFNVAIAISDTGYTYRAYNYYEKPIEKGITNEYSKIEYRWWDYRQGHPWSAEDKKLFTGLNNNSRTLLTSFKTIMDK
ncbi:DUF4468 domain-containing protein [Mucilaginibacter sp. SG564]|uniref:DUF4468 domain-containing protein n=1 Tax=unclassified Mucilaginibacter TaxID=2617802 RepID=UPI0015533E46|nr:DUF4468 domain-containing protein [Mucilaginibacter sp. SG564]NOW96827.1 hypothetical protein [Mucilaginibacter sp. SG564]